MDNKIARIKKHIYDNNFIHIGNPPKCGKTTFLAALDKSLRDRYLIVSININMFSPADLISDNKFCNKFIKQAVDSLLRAKSDITSFTESEKKYVMKWDNKNISSFGSLGDHISEMCKDKEIVLLIDNADKSINDNYKVFTSFINMLKVKQIYTRKGKSNTFKSVIFAGVFDSANTDPIEQMYNIKFDMKMDFGYTMPFREEDIEVMLNEYDTDNKTNMDAMNIAHKIYEITGGHPMLVSKICKIIDEKLYKEWTSEGIRKEVELIHLYAAHNINYFV
jgi:hypothetical protein